MKRTLWIISFILAAFSEHRVQAQDQPRFTRTESVVYGSRSSIALTLDVFEPENKNGAAVLWVVSGGFYSDRTNIRPADFRVFLERGYTVFAVVPGSIPRFTILEIQEDVQRAVRYVRHNARQWVIDPQKLGISGTSSGGNLALAAGAYSKSGKANTQDAVDQESSAVQAVACFCPPTDFLNWSKPGEVAPRLSAPAFWQPEDAINNQQQWGVKVSPIYHITAAMPATLIIHGDTDTLVPLYQVQAYAKKCKDVGAALKLIIKPGAGHGYPGWQKDIPLLADWFDQHLLNRELRSPLAPQIQSTNPTDGPH